MRDHQFRVKFLPSSPGEHAARRAVLYRLVKYGKDKRSPATLDDWEVVLQQVLARWRIQVAVLCSLGVTGFMPVQVWRARNCQPWGLGVVRKNPAEPSVCCRRLDICPWCSAREAHGIYQRLFQAAEPDTAIATAVHNDLVDSTASRKDLAGYLRHARLILDALARANSKTGRGCLWSIRIEPPSPIYRYRPDCYRVRYRFLVLLRPQESALLLPRGRTWHRRFRVSPLAHLDPAVEPSPELHSQEIKRLQDAAATVCAYPAGVLSCDTRQLQLALEARRGLRLSEMTGVLRGQLREICNHGGDELGQDEPST
jgi:hypothetical protein